MAITRSSTSAFFPLPPTIVVASLLAITLRARPSMASSMLSSLSPTSSEITFAPVSTAMSASISFLRSPKAGAFTASALNVPRSLLTTRSAKASPSTSSAIITKFLETCTNFSKKGTRSAAEEIFLSVTRMKGSSYSASMRSGLVIM